MNFLRFLQLECSTIKAFVDEVSDSETSIEDLNTKIDQHISQIPQLIDCFQEEITDLQTIDCLRYKYLIIDKCDRELRISSGGN
jgi:hypothetical protein